MNSSLISIDSVLADPLALGRQADFAIGYVGLDIPEDILAAPGMYSLHLPWTTGAATPRADLWLEDSFPGWARSMVESWLAGEFDFLRYVVFSRGDDTAHRLYYYLCELQLCGVAGGPTPLIFDIARIRKPSSLQWTIAAVQQLSRELGLGEDALQAGIEIANARRGRLRELAANRTAAGSACERLTRALLFAPLESLNLELEPAGQNSRGRLLLAGSSPPDDHLHRVAEEAHWNVVGEAYDRSLERLGAAVPDSPGTAAERIGRHIHDSEIGPRSFHSRASRLLEVARRSRASAAVFWLAEEDEAIAWDLASSRRALQDSGLPHLVLTRRKWGYSDAPGAEITDFLEGLQP
jgi:hypothetical protein